MIGKNMRLLHKGSGKTTIRARLNNLLDYLDKGDQGENVSDVWYMNELDIETADRVMIALSESNSKAKLPYRHMILSWPEEEKPNLDQMREAASILINEIGCNGCLVKCAAHYDTKKRHIHVVVVTTDPFTLKARKTDHIVKAIHRALAKIEFKQGWKPEKNALYTVNDDGECVDLDRDPNKNKAKPQKARTMELKTGRRSAVDILQAEVIPLLKIKSINSWEYFHRELMNFGIRYETKGSGACFIVREGSEDTAVKASSVSSKLTLRSLEKKFGSYQQSKSPHPPRERQIEPLKLITPLETEHWLDIQNNDREVQERKAKELQVLYEQYKLEMKALIQYQKSERERILNKDWKGLAIELGAMKALMAATHAKQKAELKDRYVALRRQKRNALKADELNSRESLKRKFAQSLLDQNFIEGPHTVPKLSYNLRGYNSVSTSRDDSTCKISIVRYVSFTDSKVHFEDHGSRIYVIHPLDPNAVRAAVQLAMEKWGNDFTVNGSDDFKAMVKEVQSDLEEGFATTVDRRRAGVLRY